MDPEADAGHVFNLEGAMRKLSASRLGSLRAVVSDVLPYEVPPTFSNRSFFRFARKVSIGLNEARNEWHSKGNAAEQALVKIMLPKQRDGNTIPYAFPVSRGNSKYRELSVPHPKSQIETAKFYEDYKSHILYFCSRSNFSIRFPDSVVRYTQIDTGVSSISEDGTESSVEDSHANDLILRSYFRYARYGNIHKFYDSPEYLSLESRYAVLSRLDISQCFNSIYTHSFAWAVLGKSQAKNDRRSNSFGNVFDKVMQSSNYGQTNGLLIGPESSRVFAEVILQDVDQRIEAALASLGLIAGQYYDIARYVDDYFVFCHSHEDCDVIKSVIAEELQKVNLRLNSEKELVTKTPYITAISLAKSAIVRALEGGFPSDIEEIRKLEASRRGFDSAAVLFDYKAAVAHAGAEHSDVVNFALAVTERRIMEMIRSLESSAATGDLDEDFIQEVLVGAVEVSGFLYGTSQRIATTIKICRILGLVVNIADSQIANRSRRFVIKEAIASTLKGALSRPSSQSHPGVERLYLLTSLHSLGRPWLLSPSALRAILWGPLTGENRLGAAPGVGYFAAVAVLHYMEGRHRYSELREEVIASCIDRIGQLEENASERALLSVDLLACPYVPEDAKDRILDHHNVPKDPQLRAQLRRGLFSFTIWSRFDLQNQLELKRNSKAY